MQPVWICLMWGKQIEDTFERNIVSIGTTELKLQIVTVEVGNTWQDSLPVLLRRLVHMIVIGMCLNEMFHFVVCCLHKLIRCRPECFSCFVKVITHMVNDNVHFQRHCFTMFIPEMEKRADTADISVLFFFGCANFWLYTHKSAKTILALCHTF